LKILEDLKSLTLPKIPDYASNNGHMFYLICSSLEEQQNLISYLKQNEINTVFHYLSLHKSPYYKKNHDGRDLIYSDLYEECLIRLPLYYEIKDTEIDYITERIRTFFSK
jgi:dTDP-4-amino-4,6-dideoxygalactose transaminase